MTKADLSNAVYRAHGGLSRRESADAVDHLLASIKTILLARGSVQISGFGCFSIVRRRSRVGRNPQTGEAIAIDSRHSLIFRPSRILIDSLN